MNVLAKEEETFVVLSFVDSAIQQKRKKKGLRMEGRMQPPTGVGSRKRQSLTLDLNSATAKRNKTVQSLLTSPDVQMLKLTSPELEKFLIQNPSLATPTPNGYVFPKSVTEEQMMYAKGFEEALAQMKQADSSTVAASEASSVVAAATTLAGLGNVAVTHTVPPPPPSMASAASTAALAGQESLPLSLPTARPDSRPSSAASGSIDSVKIKDEPDDQSLSGGEYQNLASPPSKSSSGVSPIDMDEQEIIKLERKRMRNRLAASKCRKRKLERISQLDDRVKQLKTENTDLAAVVKKMKASVALLKQEVIEHVSSGCEIRMTESTSFS